MTTNRGLPIVAASQEGVNRSTGGTEPENWRRRYMLGERSAQTGSMFLGRRVDDAITLYYRRILEHGEHLTVDQVKDAFRDGWRSDAEAEREQLGIAWEEDLREEGAFKIGLDAIELTFARLIPHLGEPVAVQRRLEYTLAPGLEWSVLCYLDLETRRPDKGALLPTVVDYKVKTTPMNQFKADHDFQPSVYLAGRWLEGDPARLSSRSHRSPSRRYVDFDICRAMLLGELCCAWSGMHAGGRGSGVSARHIWAV